MPPVEILRAAATATETVDTMPIAELERRVCHAHALLEQAESMLPGVSRLNIDLDLPPRGPAGEEREWLTRRAVLSRLAKRAAQLGARLTDAAWCMEQQARAELLESAAAQPVSAARSSAANR